MSTQWYPKQVNAQWYPTRSGYYVVSVHNKLCRRKISYWQGAAWGILHPSVKKVCDKSAAWNKNQGLCRGAAHREEWVSPFKRHEDEKVKIRHNNKNCTIGRPSPSKKMNRARPTVLAVFASRKFQHQPAEKKQPLYSPKKKSAFHSQAGGDTLDTLTQMDAMALEALSPRLVEKARESLRPWTKRLSMGVDGGI